MEIAECVCLLTGSTNIFFLSSFTWKLLAFIDKLRQSKGKRKGILGEIKSGGLTALRDRGAPWIGSHAPVEREEGRKENKVRGKGRNKE